MKESFTYATKRELAKVKFGKREQLLAEIAAFAYSCGTVSLGRGTMTLTLSSELEEVCARMGLILRALYGAQMQTVMHTLRQPKHMTVFSLNIAPGTPEGQLLFDIGLLEGTPEAFSMGQPKPAIFEGFPEATLRGAFLGCGMLCDPRKHYRLEFVLLNGDFSGLLAEELSGCGVHAKLFERGGRQVLYIKSVEQILDLLVMAGAHATMLEMENVRVVKEVRNNINRHGNCDMANMEKMASASARQQQDIEVLEKMGIEKLSPALREVCELRREYPEASLAQLSEATGGRITRSALNKRFAKLREIAEEWREKL